LIIESGILSKEASKVSDR